MGNCWALRRPSEGSCLGAVNAKPEKVLQVVKIDGKILEFRAPILVKDVLVKFSGSGIGLSKTVTQHLPLDYILPSEDPVGAPTPERISSVGGTQQTGGVRRIKVVIRKQELQQLLTKQISVEEVLAGLEKSNGNFVVSPRNWKPKLESISEENE
ncbi:PREDICTED: uncharacterized protein LOC18605849 [Theobroma cacao]|uniref:Uncharacterized protein LOC18605849 n=1 Tax=Theobroma cacao TaxID=3641 RepID=A0AB32W1W9_THECC|nr:PREDICTED: uncharacterized protein LOC18605849 [Theobroma cacao]